MSLAKVAVKCQKCKNKCKMEAYMVVDKCADFIPKEVKK